MATSTSTFLYRLRFCTTPRLAIFSWMLLCIQRLTYRRAVLYLRLIQTILNLAAFTTLDLLVPPRVQILGLLLVLLVPPRYRIRVQQSYCSGWRCHGCWRS